MSQPVHHGANHGGTMGGGDGAAFSGGSTIGHQGHGHNFLGHLLGLDQNHGHGAHSGHHQHHTGAIAQTPQGSISWSSALQGMKLSDAFQGINVTPNTLFMFLFLGFFLWLYVIYFVRHHEPLANQVIGTGGGYSKTAADDRNLVASIRHAVPIRTSSGTGSVYVPIPGQNTPGFPGSIGASMAAQTQYAPGAEAYSSAPPPAVSSYPAADQQPYGSAQTSMGAYHLPVHSGDGMRLKTVVNR